MPIVTVNLLEDVMSVKVGLTVGFIKTTEEAWTLTDTIVNSNIDTKISPMIDLLVILTVFGNVLISLLSPRAR
jgi:hypothetical protein